MDRLQGLEIFVAVAELESFAAAARRLGLSPPAVTRAVAAVEAHVGVKLLNRTTRHVRMTEAGQRYLDDARRILAELDAADEAAAGINAAPRGHLTVTAPSLFGRIVVMPRVVEYLDRYPAMDIGALFLDRVVNLLEEGVDVGVRLGPLPDSSLHAIHVGSVHRVVCAAPAYLAGHGVPRSPADLAAHRIVLATAVTSAPEWKFEKNGKSTVVRVKPRLTATTNDAAIEAAVHGFGVTRVMSYQVAPLLESGRLVAVCAEFDDVRLPVHVVHHAGRHAPAKVRSFVDHMVARLRADPSLGGP